MAARLEVLTETPPGDGWKDAPCALGTLSELSEGGIPELTSTAVALLTWVEMRHPSHPEYEVSCRAQTTPPDQSGSVAFKVEVQHFDGRSDQGQLHDSTDSVPDATVFESAPSIHGGSVRVYCRTETKSVSYDICSVWWSDANIVIELSALTNDGDATQAWLLDHILPTVARNLLAE